MKRAHEVELQKLEQHFGSGSTRYVFGNSHAEAHEKANALVRSGEVRSRADVFLFVTIYEGRPTVGSAAR